MTAASEELDIIELVKWGRLVMSDFAIPWTVAYQDPHPLNGPEFDQTPGDRVGQRSLVCYTAHGIAKSWLSNWTTTALKRGEKTEMAR